MHATRLSVGGVALFAVAITGVVGQNGNPGFPSYFAITPENTPGVQGVPTDIDAWTFNYGSDPVTDVKIELSHSGWGMGYAGWVPIGTTTFDLAAGANYQHTFTHTFDFAAHACLQVVIVDPGSGGNTDTNDDRVQINWDVISADDAQEIDLYIPFGNGADEEIVVNGTEIVCVNGTEIIPCPFARRQPPGGVRRAGGLDYRLSDADTGGSAPGDGADTTMDANSEILTRLSIPPNYIRDTTGDSTTVMVRAEMGPAGGPREKIHAMITIMRTTVATLLNEPHLCCIQSIKLRVMLESILADALDAYEAKDCKLALKLLRMFVQKAKLLECDLTDDEIKCIQKAIHKIVDAGLMIVRELGDDSTVAKAERKKKILQEAIFFRRSGLYEAALLEAGKAC